MTTATLSDRSGTVKRPPKPKPSRPKPPRSVRWLEAPTEATDWHGALEIKVGKKSTTYIVKEIACDFGDRAYVLDKLDPDLETEEVYHVLLDGPGGTCDCIGHEMHGHCKHRDALAALYNAGAYFGPTSAPACPQCNRPTVVGFLCDRCEAQEQAFAAHGEGPGIVSAREARSLPELTYVNDDGYSDQAQRDWEEREYSYAE